MTIRLNRLESLFEKSVAKLETQVQALNEKMALLMPQEGYLVPLSKELRDDHQALVPMTSILSRTCYDILLSDPTN